MCVHYFVLRRNRRRGGGNDVEKKLCSKTFVAKQGTHISSVDPSAKSCRKIVKEREREREREIV